MPILLIISLLISPTFAKTFPGSMLLEDVPFESEVQLTKPIVVEFTQGIRLYFQVGFMQGTIGGDDIGYGHAHVDGQPFGPKFEKNGKKFCFLEDITQHYGESLTITIPVGTLFTVRGRQNVSDTRKWTGSPNTKEVQIFNMLAYTGSQKPSLDCVNTEGNKLTIGDLKEITGDLLRIVPGSIE